MTLGDAYCAPIRGKPIGCIGVDDVLSVMESASARALEFAVLTSARTSEVIEATWDEINLKDKVWTIPAHRMKPSR